MASEEAESCGDMAGIERRDVGPDEHNRTRGAGFERAAHAHSEVARALSDNLYPVTPMPGAAAGVVGSHRYPQTPAPILRETAQQQRDHRPLEAKRCDIADIAREPPLACPELWRPYKQDKSAPHQP
jgi:hypothetical protein